MEFSYPQGATPLDPDEVAGLIPPHISTQGQLNVWEEVNILKGEHWALRQRKHDLLEEGFLRELHQQMFDDTWRWAGVFRLTEKNIGVPWEQIAESLRNLLDNTRYQLEKGVFEVDECAARYHHQLVAIHLFPNGNGRHARLATDMLLLSLGQKRFSWGGGEGQSKLAVGELRQEYLKALRAADKGNYSLLLKFVRL